MEMYQFKAKDSEIKMYPLCLSNISKDFTIDHMKKKSELQGILIFFLLIIDLLIITMKF